MCEQRHDEADEGVVAAVAMAFEAAGDGVQAVHEEGEEWAGGGDGSFLVCWDLAAGI